ncbi:hypothetical protein SAMN05216338_103466 [Bradyrhizobium sp. Rc2d]|nr:hypothetical protein SAMN05216338_103466 [Bradyrhizobium sp. Rc2d]
MSGSRNRSPDGAKRNPGFSRLDRLIPDCASLHSGYWLRPGYQRPQ